MANVNVNRNVTDQFYRYKMPKIIAKVEGKGNGIKTVIVNMPEVAKSLVRPPTYPTKFFGCELGAQTQFDLKNDRFIVNGSHDSNKLQDLLDVFIRKFVLCPECDNPETFLHAYPRKGMITQRCIACGHQNNVDMRHKLTTFILKNPPDQDPTIGSTPNKKEKKKDKKGKKDSVNGEAENEENNTSAEPQHVEVIPKPKTDDDSDDDWGDDVSEAAVNERMKALTEAAKNLALTDDLEKTLQERINLFYDFVKEKKEGDSVVGSEKEIVAKADQLEVKEKAPMILAELLFDESIASQIKQYRLLFLRFTHENQKAQKYLLGGFEQLVGNVYKDSLLPKVPHILKMLYDTDILEEETIIDWDKKASKKYVSKDMSKQIHEKAAPFITWLKEAEEEEESSEEEDEVEVVYSHTEKTGVQTVKPANQTAVKQEEEEDDDLDIDNI